MTLWALGDKRPHVDQSAWVHEGAQLIGAVVVHEGASIWPGAVLRADFGGIEIGPGSSVQDNAVVHPSERYPTRIGTDCIIGHAAHLEGVWIEDAVLVGSASVVLRGAHVETGAMIVAGALVPQGVHVPAGHRAIGLPAQLVAHDGDVVAEQTRAGARTYRRLAERYRTELRLVEEP